MQRTLASCLCALLILAHVGEARRVRQSPVHTLNNDIGMSMDVVKTTGPPSILGPDQLVEIGKIAVKVLEKAIQAISFSAKCRSLKLALEECGGAAEEAQAVLERLASKLADSTAMLVKSGLKEFLNKVQQGLASAAEIRDMMTKDLDGNGDSDFLDALNAFKELSAEFIQFVTSIETVSKVVSSVRDAANSLSELTDEIINLDMSIVDDVESQIVQALDAVRGFADDISTRVDLLRETLVAVAKNEWKKVKTEVEKQVIEAFGGLDAELKEFTEIFEDVVKPMVVEIAKAIKKLKEMLEDFIGKDKPESVSDEITAKSKCVSRMGFGRIFKTLDNVDTDKTMECKREFFGRYRCTCIGRNDCYVRDRPEPKDLKRCMRKRTKEEAKAAKLARNQAATEKSPAIHETNDLDGVVDEE